MGRPREERAVGREARAVSRPPDYCDGHRAKWSDSGGEVAEPWTVITVLDANHFLEIQTTLYLIRKSNSTQSILLFRRGGGGGYSSPSIIQYNLQSFVG